MPPVSSSPPVSTITRMSSTLKDLFIYIYDLSPLDMDVLIILVKNNSNLGSGVGRTSKKSTAVANKPTMTLEEISKDANRDKTSVFRSLQKLVNLGICNKEAKTQKGGGLYHLYSAIDMQIFKMETEKKVKELEASFRRILKQFEEDMDNMVKTFYQA
jgi:predicted transcriptional regulator